MSTSLVDLEDGLGIALPSAWLESAPRGFHWVVVLLVGYDVRLEESRIPVDSYEHAHRIGEVLQGALENSTYKVALVDCDCAQRYPE